jgi:hypothetical protein
LDRFKSEPTRPRKQPQSGENDLNELGNLIITSENNDVRPPPTPPPQSPVPSPKPLRAAKSPEPKIHITAKSKLGIGLSDAITLERPKGTPQSAAFRRKKLLQLEELQADHTYSKNRTLERVQPYITEFLSDFAEDGRLKERLRTCEIPIDKDRWRDYLTNLFDVISHIPDKTATPGCHTKFTRGGKRSKRISKTHTRKLRR